EGTPDGISTSRSRWGARPRLLDLRVRTTVEVRQVTPLATDCGRVAADYGGLLTDHRGQDCAAVVARSRTGFCAVHAAGRCLTKSRSIGPACRCVGPGPAVSGSDGES